MNEDLIQKRNELEDIIKKIKNSLSYDSKEKLNEEEYKSLWIRMVFLAREIHNKWSPTPRHHRCMIKNRGCSPDEPAFYDHIHSVEDLIKFTYNDKANEDPEDQTLDNVFYMNIHSRRWGHVDRYQITRNNKGWIIVDNTISGQSDKSGNPYLFKNLDHDSINYPEELPGYMEWLWDRAAEDGLTHEQLQDALNELADWINVCESNSPSGVWEHYK
ncbi:MAG TPA: hypothetical protein DET40_00310 [Lentisphaeria bacterium]|nr:MAG: hypothetical protein A2X45_10775 [Lentisphaerae bacterium GWF2_50_93]HCE41975.1 hypothetical protein [Lentisphaeria bacterium]